MRSISFGPCVLTSAAASLPLMLITRLTGFLWGQMKPFIRGKILFSPDTPATRRIMGAVNATFSPIEGVRRYDVTNEMTI